MTTNDDSNTEQVEAIIALVPTLDEADAACAASGLKPEECAPVLFDSYANATAVEMAHALILAWQSSITFEICETAMRECRLPDKTRAYPDELIVESMEAVIISEAELK